MQVLEWVGRQGGPVDMSTKTRFRYLCTAQHTSTCNHHQNATAPDAAHSAVCPSRIAMFG